MAVTVTVPFLLIADDGLHMNVFIKIKTCKDRERVRNSVGETASSHVEQMNARDECGSKCEIQMMCPEEVFSYCESVCQCTVSLSNHFLRRVCVSLGALLAMGSVIK